MLSTKIVLSAKTKNNLMYTTSTEFVIFSFLTCNSMNNLLLFHLYFGLVDARMSASDIDLPVPNFAAENSKSTFVFLIELRSLQVSVSSKQARRA